MPEAELMNDRTRPYLLYIVHCFVRCGGSFAVSAAKLSIRQSGKPDNQEPVAGEHDNGEMPRLPQQFVVAVVVIVAVAVVGLKSSAYS